MRGVIYQTNHTNMFNTDNQAERNIKNEVKLMSKYLKVIDFIKRNPQMTIKEFVKKFNLADSTIRFLINSHKLTYKKICERNRITLTPKEDEVMKLLSKGFNYKYIAKLMQIKLSTLKTHVNNIRNKLLISYDINKHNALTYLIYEYLERKKQ